jgi:chromosome segregation ATPase
LGLLDGVQSLATSLEDPLTNASASLNTANTAISTLRDLGSQLGESASENTPIFDSISDVIQEQLSPTIDKLREIFAAIMDSLDAINSAIEALNMLPGVNLPTLSQLLEDANQLVQDIEDAIGELQSSVEDFKAGVVQDVSAALSSIIEPIANLLVNLEELVNTSLERIDSLQAGVAELQEKLPTAIDLLTVASTIVLFWLILAQVSLFLAARFYLKSGRLLWESVPGDRSPVDPALEP